MCPGSADNEQIRAMKLEFTTDKDRPSSATHRRSRPLRQFISPMWARDSTGFREPRLKHQHAPEGLGGIFLAGDVRPPAPLDEVCIEKALTRHALGVEQILRPAAKRTLQPFADRDGEPGFWTVEQLLRCI